ncbi:hypothetical protein D3C75_757400 [compost metagenome]
MDGSFRKLRLLGRIGTVCSTFIKHGLCLIQLRQNFFAPELLRHFIILIEFYGELLVLQIIRCIRNLRNLTLRKGKMLVHVQSRQSSRQYGEQKNNQTDMYYIGSPAAETVFFGQQCASVCLDAVAFFLQRLT